MSDHDEPTKRPHELAADVARPVEKGTCRTVDASDDMTASVNPSRPILGSGLGAPPADGGKIVAPPGVHPLVDSPQRPIRYSGLGDPPPGAETGPGITAPRSEWAYPKPAQPVQRKVGAGEQPGAEDVHAAAARGIASPETALPHADKIQASFGTAHDISQIRAHVGGDAARAMGAQAYATGDHVVFDKSPDLHTAAHEVAHVMQQRAGVHLKGGIDGGASDPYEQHADQVADAVTSGRSAEGLLRAAPGGGRSGAAPGIQRKGPGMDASGEGMEVTAVPPVIEAGTAEAVDDGAGKQIQPGQAGYARPMLAATAGRAERMAHNYTDSLLTNLAPDLGGFDEYARVRAHEKELFIEEAEPVRIPIVGWKLGNAPSARQMWRDAGTWCQERMNEAEQDRASEQEQFSKYNAWVPRANGFFTSLERLQAQSWMIGHRNDTGSLAAAIVEGLAEAERVGHMAQAAHDRGDIHANLPPLPSDGSLLQASTACTQAAREMNAAYLPFQAAMITQRSEAINHEGDADRAHLQEINETKEFIKNVGKTVDVAAAVVEGAPAKVANATEYVQRAGATVNGMRNRRQVMNGERPTHNPTYVTTDEHGNMVVRNMQTHTERNVATGERGDMAEDSAGLPDGVESLLGSIADFAFASEVREINIRLQQILSRVTAANVAAAFVRERAVTEAYQVKLNAFAVACNNLQARMSERRQQYLEYGVALDNFARTDAKARHTSSAVTHGGDYFATIMTVTSAIREAVSMGNGAIGSFMSDDEIAAWARGINDRRSRVDCPMRIPGHPLETVRSFQCTDSEWQQMSSMWSQVKGFREYAGQTVADLAPVEERAKLMLGPATQTPDGEMHGLSQGGGSGEY